MYDASSDAKNATARATSCGVPARPAGMPEHMKSLAACGMAAVISVSIKPGATALTVMPRDATSRASDLVIPMRPALLAA